jgi:peptidoglycan-N-acetylglucosamine deacetylase
MRSNMTAAALGLGLAGSALYVLPWLLRQYRVKRLRKQMASNRMLTLTYDDGPSALTPKLLDLLKGHEAHATFFLLGRNVERHSQLVDRMVGEGHDLGCHSDQHLDAWKVTPGKALADIDAGYERLSPWIPPDGMFRPPHGKMTLPTYLSLRRRRAPVWWWTIDSGDTWDVLPKPAEVAEKLRLEGGGVVLMHDLDRSQQRNEFVLETTAALLDVARQEAIQVKPLRELCL